MNTHAHSTSMSTFKTKDWVDLILRFTKSVIKSVSLSIGMSSLTERIISYFLILSHLNHHGVQNYITAWCCQRFFLMKHCQRFICCDNGIQTTSQNVWPTTWSAVKKTCHSSGYESNKWLSWSNQTNFRRGKPWHVLAMNQTYLVPPHFTAFHPTVFETEDDEIEKPVLFVAPPCSDGCGAHHLR
jgi:hypothetical protein